MPFMYLYARMLEQKAIEMKPTSSICDPLSPKSDSIAGITPRGFLSGGRGGFFREAPQSTTNKSGQRFDLSTPKGSSGGLNLDDFKVGIVIPQTPKVSGKAIDFGDGLDDISEAIEDEEKEHHGREKVLDPSRKRYKSPRAEIARNALAERARANMDKSGDEDESRQLPDEEYFDFLSSYEEPKWWTSPSVTSAAGEEKSGVLAEGEPSEALAAEDDFPSLDEFMTHELQRSFHDTTSLKQRFTDINRQPRNGKDLFPAPLQLLTKRIKRCKACTK